MKKSIAKKSTSIRLDADLLERLRLLPNYNAFINETIKMRMDNVVSVEVMSRDVELFSSVNLNGFEIKVN